MSVATHTGGAERGKDAAGSFSRRYHLWRNFLLLVDAVAIANAALIGLEVEHPGGAFSNDTLRSVLCVFYIAEMAIRLYADPRGFLTLGLLSEVTIVVLACGCILVLDGKPVMLWQASLFRVLRISRVWRFAKWWWPLKDLWLLLVGVAHAGRALAWFALVLFVVLFAEGGATMGLIGNVNADGLGPCSADAVEAADCIDGEEYFGSLSRSMLTMLQVSTLDGWAAKVRPLAGSRPLAAAAVTGFAVCTAYALCSVVLGVIAQSTLALARSHECHSSQVALTEDLEMVAALGATYQELLDFDGQPRLDLIAMRNAMGIPLVKKCYERLDLPVQVPDELFQHLDKTHCGSMSVEEFVRGVSAMKRPARNYDFALLTATIGGSATYCSRIDKRAIRVSENMERLKETLTTAFDNLSTLADPMAKNSVPEVYLRSAGRIFNPIPSGKSRYTS
mmetsp:Transcript_20932/g.60417  ORF Transcript_20932/g.60417 Transcript_20932/m.60417 type:complete len:449 (-) Transcript_20932:155-1501(-)